MSQLATLLETQAEPLLRRWVELVREGIAPGGETEPELLDHLPLVLRELAVALRQGRLAAGRASAGEHGRQRYRLGFDVGMVVRECGLLRNVILDAAEAGGLAVSMAEIRVLSDFISQTVAEGVTEHNQQRLREETVRASASLQIIREREARLATTLSSIGDAVISTDARGHITFVNAVAESLTGWSAQDAAGQPMAQVFCILDERTRLPVDSPVERVLRGGIIASLADHTVLVRRDGTEIPIDDSAAPIRGEGGELTGVVLVFRDVSDKKRAEAEREALLVLEQSARAEAEAERAKQHSLFMQAPVAIAILEGPSHVYSFANPAYRALVNGRDVVGKTLLEALPDLKGQGVDRLLDQVMTTGETFSGKEVPLRLEHHTGDELLHLNFVYSAKRDAAGVIDGVLVSAFDVTEQVLARQRAEVLADELRASEERQRRVVEASGAVLWELDAVTGHIESDARMVELMGLPTGSTFSLASGLDSLPSAEDRQRVADELASALGGKSDGRYLVEFRTGGQGDAPLRWVESRARVSFDADGQAQRLSGAMIDITARKLAEAERQGAQAQMAQVLDSMGDGFFALDASWRLRMVNRNHEIKTQSRREDLLGRHFWDVYPVDRGSTYWTEYHRCMEQRVAVQFVDYYAPLDLWTDVRAYPTAEGGMSVFFRDVSVEKQSSEALRRSEERYRTLFESIDDGFCLIQTIVDRAGVTVDYRFLETNAAFEGHTGLKDAAGKTILSLVPDLHGPWISAYGHVVDTGETLRFENHEPAMNRWFEVYASRVGSPETRQVAIVFKDITARKRAEQERERLLGELARSNTALDQFAYVASHDLKAPLRGIANLSHWIEDDLGDAVTDDAREKLGLLRGRVQRLEELVNGILNYSTAGRSQARPEAVAVGPLLAEVVGLLSPPPHVTITVGESMPTFVVERVPFEQVFMNLIGNAVKHTPGPDATIRLDVTDEDAFYHFTVTDNGPGIAPQFHERIWGIFQKLASRSSIEGTGIGLSVVKKIVESRGGRTWVESTEGHGATFHVLWPRRPQGEAT